MTACVLLVSRGGVKVAHVFDPRIIDSPTLPGGKGERDGRKIDSEEALVIKDTFLSPSESLLIIPCKPAAQSLFIHLCGRGEAGVSKGTTLPILAGTTVWHLFQLVAGHTVIIVGYII